MFRGVRSFSSVDGEVNDVKLLRRVWQGGGGYQSQDVQVVYARQILQR